MIRIMKYGEVSNAEIFDRSMPTVNVTDTVAEIIRNVRERGDAALREYTEKFDGAKPENLVVTPEEMEEALAQTTPEFMAILEKAAANIRKFHSRQVRDPIRDKVTERFGNTRIRCMMVDEAGALWVCTYGSGLVEICADGTEYVYNRDNSAFGNRARVVSQLRDGTVLAAGDTGLSFIRDHRVERTITYTEGEISSMVLTITELKDGTILAGTDGNGLAVIADGEVEQMLTRADGLSSEVILRTVRDPKTGGVFVVTSNGLCYMDINRTIRTLDNFPYFNN